MVEYAGELSKLGAECMVVSDDSRGWHSYFARKPKLGAECMVVDDPLLSDRALRHIHLWRRDSRKFQNLIDNFQPDVVVCNANNFGMAALRSNIPLVVYLTINPWQKRDSHRAMMHRTSLRWITHRRYDGMLKRCMLNSAAILTISRSLENVVREKHPGKSVFTLSGGMYSDSWYPEKGMTLKHPCVGLIQEASIWDKTKELLVLERVLDKLPDVTFYWAGDGEYTDKILSSLRGYANFRYLGRLEHPDGIRKFLTEIDIYALLSGMDALPRAIREALLMGKPVIATNIGGIPELVEHGKSGFLVNQGDANGIVEKITRCLEEPELAGRLGTYGRQYIKKNFSPDATTRRFMDILREINLR